MVFISAYFGDTPVLYYYHRTLYTIDDTHPSTPPLHLSTLLIPPTQSRNDSTLITLEYTAGIDVLKWTYRGALGTVIGARLGAVPVSLRWNRDWQVCFFTLKVFDGEMVDYNCGGTYIGHAMGLILGVICTGVWKRDQSPWLI